jgi:hypothetical protein
MNDSLNISEKIQMPAAWYDLSCRVSAVQAVAFCVSEALPVGLTGLEYERFNQASYMISAIHDLLGLMIDDVKLIETQLKL